jgi:hypothetical protein
MPCFPSDIPSILFFTLGLSLLFKNRMLPYYILFAIATLNRETSCFLTFAYLFASIGKIRLRTVALHCVSQLILWAGIKYFLYRAYAENPGTGLWVDTLTVNLSLLKDPRALLTLSSMFGYTWIPTLVCYRLIPVPFIRRSVLVILPFLIAMMFFGYITELRIFGELIPIVLTAFLLIVRGLFSKEAGGSRRRPASVPSL